MESGEYESSTSASVVVPAVRIQPAFTLFDVQAATSGQHLPAFSVQFDGCLSMDIVGSTDITGQPVAFQEYRDGDWVAPSTSNLADPAAARRA